MNYEQAKRYKEILEARIRSVDGNYSTHVSEPLIAISNAIEALIKVEQEIEIHHERQRTELKEKLRSSGQNDCG